MKKSFIKSMKAMLRNFPNKLSFGTVKSHWMTPNFFFQKISKYKSIYLKSIIPVRFDFQISTLILSSTIVLCVQKRNLKPGLQKKKIHIVIPIKDLSSIKWDVLQGRCELGINWRIEDASNEMIWTWPQYVGRS